MDKSITILFVLIIMLSFFSNIIFTYVFISKLEGQVNICPTVSFANITCQYNVDYSEPFFVSKILERFANTNNFTVDQQPCVSASENLSLLGKMLNITFDTKIAHNNNTGHEWLAYCFDIEPQNGKAVDYSENYMYNYSDD